MRAVDVKKKHIDVKSSEAAETKENMTNGWDYPKIKKLMLLASMSLVLVGTLLLTFKYLFYENSINNKQLELQETQGETDWILRDIGGADKDYTNAWDMDLAIQILSKFSPDSKEISTRREELMNRYYGAVRSIYAAAEGNSAKLGSLKGKSRAELEPLYASCYGKAVSNLNERFDKIKLLKKSISNMQYWNSLITIMIGIFNSFGLVLGFISNYLDYYKSNVPGDSVIRSAKK